MDTDKKIVSVTLSETDEKALTGGKTRRRRQRRNAEEMASTDVQKEIAPVPVQTPVQIPVQIPVQTQAPALTAQTGGVKLAAKKHSGTPAPSITPAPKILGKKKSNVIAQTIKKPKLLVQKKEETKNHTIKQKRTFTARKISLILKPFASTRKQRKQLKDKIAKMPAAAIRKVLIQKGLMKPKANPPDDISRNMLHDFMMLHAIE